MAVAHNSISVRAAPEAVFAVLDDACAYPRWVVGARRVRAVDAEWPKVGSRFHHAIGTAAGELHDSSKVLERDPPRLLVLEVRFRPTGIARVELRLASHGDRTGIEMDETMIAGPAALLPGVIVDPLLTLRNALSLWRLRREVERSAARTRYASAFDNSKPS